MRRLYRSGESEYLIDGENCRLRDVQDLLMDAGLGIKAYAVIEQGKIGQILSARPTDRRQLIEEAAGVTKYKSRRRQAELKLEAAQQNLTRVDDIVFEVEKQRGTLKRQAAKARRYRRLRDELRRWEKVQFANRYRVLGQSIESARTRLADARAREAGAAAHLAEVEATLERLRLELTEADSNDDRRARSGARPRAGDRPPAAADRVRQAAGRDRSRRPRGEIEQEVQALDARREPARLELEARRDAQARAAAERTEAADTMQAEEAAYAGSAAQHRRARGGRRGGAQRSVRRGQRRDRAAPRHGARGRRPRPHLRAAEQARGRERRPAGRGRARGTRSAPPPRRRWPARARRWSACAWSARRASRSWPVRAPTARRARREYRTREHELAGLLGRLKSLEELAAARAEYGDARPARARRVRATTSSQMGSVADFLEVEAGYERAVEACLGDLLQHVVVPTARARRRPGCGSRATSEAGRVGFLVAEAAPVRSAPAPAPGLVAGHRRSPASPVRPPMRSAPRSRTCGSRRATRPARDRGRGDGRADRDARRRSVPRRAGRRGGRPRRGARHPHDQARDQGAARARRGGAAASSSGCATRSPSSTSSIAGAESAILSLQGELHRQEKAIVGFELQIERRARGRRTRHPQAGPDRHRAAVGRGGAARPGGAPGRGARVDRADRVRAARAPTNS